MDGYDSGFDSFKLGFLLGWRTGGKRTRLPLSALTSGEAFEKQLIGTYTNLTACDIACKRTNTGNTPEAIYISYIADGSLHVVSSLNKKNIGDHTWVDSGFIRSAIDTSIAFDGYMPRTLNGSEFITDERPYVFWVTPEGALKCSILGFIGETILAEENCTKCSAVRATYSDLSDLDFGLVVFFIINGSLYYKQLVGEQWYDAEVVSAGPSGLTFVDIVAFRTWDYRIGVQALMSDGNVYEIFSMFEGMGRLNAEHAIDLTNIQVLYSNLTSIEYLTLLSKEHFEFKNISVISKYGGLYAVGMPVMVSAYNLEDSNHNWGTQLIVTFDKQVDGDQIEEQLSTIRLVDSLNVTFIPTSCFTVDGRNFLFTFLDFNNARGQCTVRYVPGTVTSMYGTVLEATSCTFTPVNLVPSVIPVPEVQRITNIGSAGTGWNIVQFYNTDGDTLLWTEAVDDGEDCTYGTDTVWTTEPNSGIAISGITEDIQQSLNLYEAKWKVVFYDYDGLEIENVEYVLDGDDCNVQTDSWATTQGGEAVIGITENVHSNLILYDTSQWHYTPSLASSPTSGANTPIGGWQFQVTSPIYITGVRGKIRSSSYTGTIKFGLASGTILKQVSVDLIANQWVDVHFDSPILLNTDTDYVISLFGNSSTLYYGMSPSFTVDSIRYITGRYGWFPGTTEGSVYYSVDILVN